jgi:predicted O-methyltransferase YrrM
MNKFSELKKYTDSIGSVYGTEDFSIYLYSLVKMLKPQTVVELGTGLGSVALWTALALEENKSGIIHTIDDGSEWDRLKTHVGMATGVYEEQYSSYIKQLITKFNFEQINFINQKIDALQLGNIDILFSDFAHGPFDIIKLLGDYLPQMSDDSMIFFDSASTHYGSYHTLETIVNCFNSGKVPRVFKDLGVDLSDKVNGCKFQLNHIVENKDRNQNSTACIRIMPVDIFPYPRVNVRF